MQIARRDALKLLACGVGVVALGAVGLTQIGKTKSASKLTSAVSSPKTTVVSTSSASSAQTSYTTIKLVYFGMAIQSTGTKQEYWTMPSPVYLSDLLAEMKRKHEVFAAMLPSMAIVVNGNPAEPNQQLSNHDEVDFVPAYAGG